MTATQTTPTQTGITVSTAITAGPGSASGILFNHAEGIVVSTAITAGPVAGGGILFNHAEGIVVSTAITAGPVAGGGILFNHAEGIVVSTPITAGPSGTEGFGGSTRLNHAEGIVVSTAITAGPASAGGILFNHAEGIVVSTAITAGPSGTGGFAGSTRLNHAEGIAVSTPITAGGPGLVVQHAEGVVVSTAITAGPAAGAGILFNHVEGIVVSTPITAGPGIGIVCQHVEGIVVSTPIAAGGWSLNHAEGTVVTTQAARRGCRSAIMAIAAGAVLLTPITALAQVPGGPPGGPSPPPAPAPPPPQAEPPPVGFPDLTAPEPAPDPPAPAPQLPVTAGELAPNLTQIYRGDDGSALYLRDVGTTVVGFAEHPVKKYAFVFRGTRKKNVINGNWYDIAKGTRQTFAPIHLKVFKKGDRLVRSGGKDFGPDVFNVISASKISWPGGREAGFQSLSRSDLDGAFIGKSAALDPDGSRLYWKENLTLGPVGVAEGPRAYGTTRPRWVSVFFSKRDDQGKIAGEYFDVPKGTETERGSFRLSAAQPQYGRRHVLQQFDSANVALEGRPTVIDPDYAINFGMFATTVDKYFRNHVVGFGYAISRNGKVVRSDGGGSAFLFKTKNGLSLKKNDFDLKRPFTSATQSDIGSSSKLVVATAVMKELDARGISINAAVAPYFPSCWHLGTGWETMKFGELLAHKSGLIRPGDSVLNQDETGYLFQKTSAETDLGPKVYDYENQNYVMLGWILAGLLDKPKVEASFEQHGCGNGSPAMLETMQIFEAYVVDMLDDQGVEGGWKWRPGPAAFPYDFSNPTSTTERTDENINASGGLKMTADELGEFMAKLEHGRFVKRSTLQTMKDFRLGVDGALNASGPDAPLGQVYQKNGSAPKKPRGYGAQITMMPGDVQVIGVWNSRYNTLTGSPSAAFLAAWRSAIK